jgi:hypothetical protein
MVNRVGQWGGSLSVRLPKNVVEALSSHIRPVKPVPADGMPAMGTAPAKPEEPSVW